MGPESGSLAYDFQRFRRRFRALGQAAARAAGTAVAAAGAVAAALAQQAPAPPLPPLPAPLVEQQQVRRVQVDVSVIDPRGDAWSSVPGLVRDHFELRLDGRPLPPAIAARTEFDAICTSGTAPGEPRDRLAGERPTIIVFADLNYLDSRMRYGVTQALERLAEIAATRPVRVKVVAYTRRIVPITGDFVSDPAAIRRAAQELAASIGAGPPLEGIAAAPTRESSKDPIDPRSVYDLTSGDGPPDPEPKPAYEVFLPEDFGLRSAEITSARNPTSELAAQEIDPRPSLAAIEAVLLAHASLRGRKALVLFSSPWFDLHEDLFLTYAFEPRRATQGGFSIWTVDARGLGVPTAPGSSSRLMEFLATGTGGEAVRAAGSLGVVFDRVISTMSCYYLFSIPLEAPGRGEARHTIDVRLDTAKHPEFWNYRVRSTGMVTVASRQKLRERRRLGALMDPTGFPLPDVRVSVGYPSREGALAVPIQVAALLADLSFLRDPERGDLVSRFAWEGLVTNDNGDPLCSLGDGVERTVRLETPPSRYPPTYLLLTGSCVLPVPGHFDVRALVEDLVTGEVGAAQVRLSLPAPVKEMARVSAVRLGRSTGRDFLLDPARTKGGEVPRDASRVAVVPLLTGESVHSADRVVLRFVACGLSGTPRTILFRPVPGADGKPARESIYQILPTPRGEVRGATTACREYEAAAPESSLAPGSYGIAIIDPAVPAASRQDIDRILSDGPVLESREFRVIPPPTGPMPRPGEPT
jgi:VWFA-related protein